MSRKTAAPTWILLVLGLALLGAAGLLLQAHGDLQPDSVDPRVGIDGAPAAVRGAERVGSPESVAPEGRSSRSAQRQAADLPNQPPQPEAASFFPIDDPDVQVLAVDVRDIEGNLLDGITVWAVRPPISPRSGAVGAEFDGAWLDVDSGRAQLRGELVQTLRGETRTRDSRSLGESIGYAGRVRFDRARRPESVVRETSQGRATLVLRKREQETRVTVFAGGPWLPPVSVDVALPREDEAPPVELVVPAFGTLELEVVPETQAALLHVGRLDLVPRVDRERDLVRGRRVLEQVALGLELDVHVLGFTEPASIDGRSASTTADPSTQGLVEVELEPRGQQQQSLLDLSGGAERRLFSDELREPVVHRVRGPGQHGTRRRVELKPGPERLRLEGAFVDDEDWNIGNFEAVFHLESPDRTLRIQRSIPPHGFFRLTLPADLATPRPHTLTVQTLGTSSTVPPRSALLALPPLRAGANDLGRVALRADPLLCSGRILDAQGVPQKGERVGLYVATETPEGLAWEPLPGPPPGRWRTDVAGTFELFRSPVVAGARLGVHRFPLPEGATPLEFSPAAVGLEVVLPADG